MIFRKSAESAGQVFSVPPFQHQARLWRSKFKENFLFIGSRPEGAMECGSLLPLLRLISGWVKKAAASCRTP
jgi:hypothetical protein